jgi:hypothetical protein
MSNFIKIAISECADETNVYGDSAATDASLQAPNFVSTCSREPVVDDDSCDDLRVVQPISKGERPA